MVPGPAPAIDSAQFFSPQYKKGQSIIAHDFDDRENANKSTNLLQNPPQPDGLKGMSLGRNNSIYLAHSRQSMFSPITHRPIDIKKNPGNGNNTTRASTIDHRTHSVVGLADLKLNQANAINFTKTSIQTRAEGQIKPKAYNAWDMLALNDLIKGRIEDQNRKEREHKQRLEMRRFYDS